MRFSLKDTLFVGKFGCVFLSILSFYYSYELFDPACLYRGHKFFVPSCGVKILSLVLAILPIGLMSLKFEKSSQIFIWGLYLFVYIPIMMITPRHMNVLTWYFLFFLMSVMSSFVFLTIITQNQKYDLKFLVKKLPFMPLFNIKNTSLSETWFNASVWVILLGSLGVLYALVGFEPIKSLQSFTYSQEYQIRMHSRELMKTSFFLKCFFILLPNILNPLFFLYALREKKIDIGLCCLLLQFYLFSITAAKFYLIILGCLGIFYALISLAYSCALGGIAIAPLFLFLSSLGMHFWYKGHNWAHLLGLGRISTAQATLTTLYYQYFSLHGCRYLSDSPMIRKLFGLQPPVRTISYTIGTMLYPAEIGCHANGNIFAMSYAQFGLLGPVICLSLCAFLLKMFDDISSKDKIFAGCAILIPTFFAFSTGLKGVVGSCIICMGFLSLMPQKARNLSREEARKNL